jgi:hypothetical protein
MGFMTKYTIRIKFKRNDFCDVQRTDVSGMIEKSGVQFDEIREAASSMEGEIVSQASSAMEANAHAMEVRQKLESVRQETDKFDTEVTVYEQLVKEAKTYQLILKSGKEVEVIADNICKDHANTEYFFQRGGADVARFPISEVQGIFQK